MAQATNSPEVLVLDDDDDDVVITGEDKINSASYRTPDKSDRIVNLKKIIAEAKAKAEDSEKDVSLFAEEVTNMKVSLDDVVFESLKHLALDTSETIKIPMNWSQLKDVVFDILEELTAENFGDMSYEEYQEYSEKLNLLERGNQAVSKMFVDCHTKLKEIKHELHHEIVAVEQEITKLETEKAPMLIDSDDDDDMCITGVTLNNQQQITSQPTTPQQNLPQQKPSQQNNPQHNNSCKSPGNNTSSPGLSKVNQTANQSSAKEGPGMPPMEELRSQFASAVSKSMPTLLNSLQSQQRVNPQTIQHQPVSSNTWNEQNKSSDVMYTGTSVQANSTGPQSTQASQLQRSMILPPHIKWPELKVGDKVLGKKRNDVWYGGTIENVYPPGVPAPGEDDSTEWRCKVKFDGKGIKVLNGKSVAYREPINCFIRVGTRIVALYREDDAPNSYFAGIIAEAPSMKNNKRFLVFFDDGYAQYCESKELHKVYTQSVNVWEDIDPDTSAFIKEYLRIYPERPMVRLSKGQVVRTEWKGKWWTSKVIETDYSLVKMYFQADKRTEWIYRGSTRLEPLFKALVNADAIKAAGSSRGRRHNLLMRPSDSSAKRPSVEYTRGASEENENNSKSKVSSNKQPDKKSNVAKKSTGGGTNSPVEEIGDTQTDDNWLKNQQKAPAQTSLRRSVSSDSGSSSLQGASQKVSNNPGFFGKAAKELSSKDIASVLQERLASTSTHIEYDDTKATGERKENTIISEEPRIPFKPHKCGHVCVKDSDEKIEKYKARSRLSTPLLCGWERQICKARPSTKRFVAYRAPCGRRLRNIEDVDKFLLLTDSAMTIDLFCFDQELHVNTEFVPLIPVKTYCDIKDLSYGIENYPVSCVNGVDRHYPDYVEYANKRIPSKGVYINTDPEFLACCDCTDNCRDASKCACQRRTAENSKWIADHRETKAGYEHKRLLEPLFTGIVECNSQCHCDKRCVNKVAQHGLQMRLQVFKTEKKGWGLRCLDDIAKGSFICIYAGQLLTDRGANEDGKQYGDEYLAELDFIEVVEGQKEGYESDVEEFSDEDKESNSDEDSDYAPQENGNMVGVVKRRSCRIAPTDKDKEKKDAPAKKDVDKKQSDIIDISDDESLEGNIKTDSVKSAESKKNEGSEPSGRKPRAKKSTGGSRFNLSTNLSFGQDTVPEKEKKEDKKELVSTRSYFNDTSECYIMDAKSMGNLGRYLNHSCSPNVFVQNIFVDTHDLRFPWVAFFAGQYIRAGTELTWDYNYEVGSVPDKILYCYCGSSTCRGRLL